MERIVRVISCYGFPVVIYRETPTEERESWYFPNSIGATSGTLARGILAYSFGLENGIFHEEEGTEEEWLETVIRDEWVPDVR